MNRVALDLGIVQIYWYSLCILVGMMVGMFVVYRETIKKKISDSLITNLIFYTIIVSIIGARLYYVIFDWGYYSKNPVEILEIWNGGLAIHGAIILGGIFLISYTKQHKLDTLKILDICSVGLIIGQAIGRWGNFFNQEVYGTEVSLEFLKGLHLPGFIIDGMHIGGIYHHPLFLYESLWCVLGFILLLIIRRRKYIKTGQIFGLYCMWYSVGRFFLEGMRDEKYNLMLGNLKAAQIVSIGMFVVGLFFFARRIKSSRFENLYNDEIVSVETTIKQNESIRKKDKSLKDIQMTAQQLNSERNEPVRVESTIPPVSMGPKVGETIPKQNEELNNLFMTTTNNEQPVINQEMQNQIVSENIPVPMIVNQEQPVEQNNIPVGLVNNQQMPPANNMMSQIPESVLGVQNQNAQQQAPMPPINQNVQDAGKKNKFLN